MVKYWGMQIALFIVSFLVFQATPPIPGQAVPDSTNRSGNVQGQSARQQQPAPAPPVVNQAPAPNREDETQQIKSRQNNTTVTVQELPPVNIRRDWLDILQWILTALLALIGGTGVLAAWKTLKAIKRQADTMDRQAKELAITTEAMKKSVLLQEANLRQWVDLGNWRASYRVSESRQTKSLEIVFEVANPTPRHITVQSLTITFLVYAGNDLVWKRESENFLPPNVSARFSVSIDITEEQAIQYLDAVLPVSVVCTIIYMDSLTEQQRQGFGGVLFCCTSGTTFDRGGDWGRAQENQESQQAS